MGRADDKIRNIYEDAKEAMGRLSNKNYRYVDQCAVYDDLRTVQKLIDSFEEGEWYWQNKEERYMEITDKYPREAVWNWGLTVGTEDDKITVKFSDGKTIFQHPSGASITFSYIVDFGGENAYKSGTYTLSQLCGGRTQQ